MAAQDLKKMYTTILGDHFPMEMKISFDDQTLVYRKRTWKITMEDGSVDERGVRYGENPDQEAALYELVNGNLMLGDCQFIEPGNGLVSLPRIDGPRDCSRVARARQRPTLCVAVDVGRTLGIAPREFAGRRQGRHRGWCRRDEYRNPRRSADGP